MATIEIPVARAPKASRQRVPWCYLLLDNLHEFATLAWYLVADGNLVEEVFSRVMAALASTPFDESVPFSAYNRTREMVVAQAVDVLACRCRDEDETQLLDTGAAFELPNLPRLAFMLRFVIRSSETEVAKYLDVSPARVRELIKDEIDYLSVSGPFSVLTGSREAEAL
jgi:hypothetical protein